MNKSLLSLLFATAWLMSCPAAFSSGVPENTNEGIPGVRVAVYCPDSSTLGKNCIDSTADARVNAAVSLIKGHFIDCNIIYDSFLGNTVKAGPAYLEGPGGEKYMTLVIPYAEGLSERARQEILDFSRFGGRVLLWGVRPTDIAPDNGGSTFRADYESIDEWTRTVDEAMPEREIEIRGHIPVGSLEYSRSIFPKEDRFTLTNTRNISLKFTARFDAAGRVYRTEGKGLSTVTSRMEDDRATAEITLEPGESACYVVRRNTGTYNVRDYGAVGNGEGKDTRAIQAAADAAYEAGGGTVVIPAGQYLTGALFFRNGVDLKIEKDATLISTVDSDDFPQIPTRFEGTEKHWRSALLNFDHSRNVRVYGEGSIDGKGPEWSINRNMDGLWGRPRMICFTDCPGGSIEGLTLRDHASWCLHVLYTDGFTIKGLNISVSSYVPSSDGVDIDSSCNVFMSEVYTNVTDDCLSIKSGKNEDGRRVGRPSMNIVVRNCNFDGGHGVAIGSEISGDIRNVLIEDCVCGPENRAPVRFKSQPSRGGTVENITFRNMSLNGCDTFIDANLMWRMVEDYDPYFPRTVLRNIRVSGIKGTVRSVGNITGDPEAPIPEGSFIFEDCDIQAESGLVLRNVKQRNFDGIRISLPEGGKAIIME